MTDSNLVAMTIRLESAVSRALASQAGKAGQEVADYAGDLISKAVMAELEEFEPEDAKRIQAELEVKTAAIKFAVAHCEKDFDPHVTLKTFQHIKSDERLNPIYLRAIGNRPGDERRNPIKARINRTLGAAIKTAVGAVPQTVHGNAVKVQVSGEFIQSYTPFDPGPAKRT